MPDETILSELKAATTDAQQKKILQTLKLRLVQSKIQEICTPINSFIANFNNFYYRVDNIRKEEKTDAQKLLIIFVGGLAANKTIERRVREAINEKKNSEDDLPFTLAANPQVAIIKGIPIQRANISLRDFDQRAHANLYLLLDKKLKDVNAQSRVSLHSLVGNLVDEYGPMTNRTQIKYHPELILQQQDPNHEGDVLAPINNKCIQNLNIKLDYPIDLFFFKSHVQNVPPFFNIKLNGNKKYVF